MGRQDAVACMGSGEVGTIVFEKIVLTDSLIVGRHGTGDPGVGETNSDTGQENRLLQTPDGRPGSETRAPVTANATRETQFRGGSRILS